MKLNEVQIENRATAAMKNLVEKSKPKTQAEAGQVLCKLLAVVVNGMFAIAGKEYTVAALSQLIDSTNVRTDKYSMERASTKNPGTGLENAVH